MNTLVNTLTNLAGRAMLLRNSQLESDTEKAAFRADLRAFLETQQEAEKLGTGILGGPRKTDTREEAFARCLAHEFFERANLSNGLAKAAEEDPEALTDFLEEFCEGFDLEEYVEELEAEVNAELAALFLQIADLGVDRAV